MNVFVFVFFFFIHISFTGAKETHHQPFLISPDSFPLNETQQGALKSIRKFSQNNPQDCRAQIQALMCLVEPAQTEDEVRNCLPGGEQYASHFEKLFDQYPPALQKVFCSLDVIYIEKEFFGTAYAGTSLKDGTTMMGIRQSVLDENLHLTQWASWKDQLSFGGKSDSYAITPHLPEVQTTSPGGQSEINDFLYFVITHEFGHILDFANKVNKIIKPCPKGTKENPYPECDADQTSWSGFSWATNKKAHTQNDFVNRDKLCFYMCEGNFLSDKLIPQIYQSLVNESNFISLYSATNPMDDFAESLAYFVMDRHLGTTYVIDTKQGSTFDVIQKLHSPLFQKKYEYIENFLNRSDLTYP